MLANEMEQPPKHIKTISTIIIVFSVLSLVGAVLGVAIIRFLFTKFQDTFDESFYDLLQEEFVNEGINMDVGLIQSFVDNYLWILLPSIIISVLFLIGGINLKKFKLWSIHLITVVGVLNILTSVVMLYYANELLANVDSLNIWNTGLLTNVIIWSIPVVVLIWYIHKRDVKKHFS